MAANPVRRHARGHQGGASGIGLAVASRIIAEGGQVTSWDVDQAKLERRKPSSAPWSRSNTA